MTDQEYMKLAIEVAKSGRGQTAPNPIVGAVVVKDGFVVGIGAHLKAGEGHAEVHAIKMAGERVVDSTVYVTLEPCSHYGKTPPCAELLVKSKVKRVVIATTDPNPLVAGKGIEILKQAGIDVEVGVLKREADELNTVFFHYIDKKTPYVTLKSATSLDGKISTVSGESQWITSKEARLDVHRYRDQHDAILVGVNTVIADDPSLTTRLPNGYGKNPTRIILDTHLRTPLSSKVLIDREADTWIIVGNQVPEEKISTYRDRAKIYKLDTETIGIKEVLKLLGQKGVTSLFVEGGAEINGSFVRERAINQIITYLAPKLLGGKSAPTSVGGPGIERLSDSLQLTIKSVEMIGKDIKVISELVSGEEER